MTYKRIFQNSASRLILVLLAGIAALLWLTALYWNALHGPFTFDDVLIFPSTQLQSVNLETVLQTLAMHNSGIFGRPTAILSFIANHHYWGADPFGYKSVNLLIHAVNSGLVFLLALTISRLILGSNSARGDQDFSPRLPAAICALLWACHPLQVSTVMYIFQRTMLLSTLFCLLAMLLYLYGRAQSRLDAKGFVALFLLFPIMLLSGVTSKENGALAIPFILVIEFVLFKFRLNSRPVKDPQCWFLLLFAAIPLGLAIAYFATHTGAILEGYESRHFTMADRLRSEAVALMFYLKLIMLPSLSDMSLFHDAFPVQTRLTIPVLVSVITVMAMAASVLFLRARLPAIALGMGLFLSAHLLESTFIPLELVFEHRNYFALFGVVFPLAWLLCACARKYFSHRAALIASAAVIALISSQTYSRSIEWSDELLLHTLAVQNKPDSVRARKLLITTLSNYGKHDLASEALNSAITLHGNRPSFDLLDLAIQCKANRPVDQAYETALTTLGTRQLVQDIPGLLNGLIAQSAAGACDGLSLEKMRALTSVASQNPDKKMPDIFKLTLYALSAQLFMQAGDTDQAIAELDRALDAVPRHPEVLIVQTTLRTQAGDVEQAKQLLTRLEAVNRKKLGAYDNAVTTLGEQLNTLVAERRDS